MRPISYSRLSFTLTALFMVATACSFGQTTYYLNDSSTTGDLYTTAVGDDANIALSPGSPKASLQTLLADYDIDPGDVIYMDTGHYTMTNQLYWTEPDAGATGNPVVLYGSTNAADGGTWIEPLTNENPYAVLIMDTANYVELNDITLAGTWCGIRFWKSTGVVVRALYCANKLRGVESYRSDFRAERIRIHSMYDDGMLLSQDTKAAIESSTIWNFRRYGIGVYHGSQITVSNTIIYANRGLRCLNGGAGVTSGWYSGDYNNLKGYGIGYDDVTGDYAGNLSTWRSIVNCDDNSISVDPLFADMDTYDMHLSSIAGRYSPVVGFVTDAVHSLCIDAGAPSSPFSNELDPNGGRRNIGAYGNTAAASLSATGSWVRTITFNDGGVAEGTVALEWGAGHLPGDTLLRVDLSSDAGSTWTQLVTGLSPTPGSYDWDSSSFPSTTQALWRIACHTNSMIIDSNNHPFVINRRPVAVITTTPSNGVAPLRVTLDGRESYDADDEIVLWELAKDAGTTFDTMLTEPGRVVLEYTKPGIYWPQLRVTDMHGGTDQTGVRLEVWGEAPTIVLHVSETNPPVINHVTFDGTNSFAAAGREIVLFELDIDGNGIYDMANTNGLFEWTYRQAGTRVTTFRVTDDARLQNSTSQVIYVTFVTGAPVVTLHADVNEGPAPLTVHFTADASGNGQIEDFKWDVDGDGAYDVTTLTNRLTHTFTTPGEYEVKVRLFMGNLIDTDTTTINVSTPSSLKAWISKPKDGSLLWGDSISLRANTAPGSQTASVQFEYQQEGSNEWASLGDVIYPPPYSFATNWNVTELLDGSNYLLRARAVDTSAQTVYSDPITVTIDSSASGKKNAIVEEVVGGVKQKRQSFEHGDTAEVGLSDGTEVVLAAGTVTSSATMTVVLTGVNTNGTDGSTRNRVAIDQNRTIHIEDSPDLGKQVEVSIPYPDADNDGFVDGMDVAEEALAAHWFDPVAGEWQRAPLTEVFPEQNLVKATVYRLAEVGLFANPSLVLPANGGRLVSYSSQGSVANGAKNLTDDNRASYWQSEPNPVTKQDIMWTIDDKDVALVDGVTVYNSGSTSGWYSQTFEVYGSMDGVNYVMWTNGVLETNSGPQYYGFSSVTCCYVQLTVSNSNPTAAGQIAEFEVYGVLTPDADGDNIRDRWEIDYFTNLYACDPGVDSDGDGSVNRDEWLADSNPWNPDSYPILPAEMTAGPEGITLSIDTATGVNYSIWYRNGAFGTENWTLATTSPVVGTGGTVEWVDDGSQTTPDPMGGSLTGRFYRCIIDRSP